MRRYELAQTSVARLQAPLDSPQPADFVDALDRINAIADGSPGFVSGTCSLRQGRVGRSETPSKRIVRQSDAA